MLVRLIEIYNKRTFASNTDGKVEEYSLREVFVNPQHVVCLRENDSLKTRLANTELGKDIHPAESYTKIYINRGQSGLDLDVVGDLTAIMNKLQGKKL
tara:strand:- start:228 stop:521 length:294 start_codon:yes stop_codon:yes gene_type:complete